MVQVFHYIIIILLIDGIFASGSGNQRRNFSKELNVSNNKLFEIKRNTFQKYRRVEKLNIVNSRVSFVADKAFYDLPRLKILNMSKNFITSLESKVFRPRNKLWKFILSHNMLDNLDTFDITHFSHLAVFDISFNRLRFLPPNILNRMKSDQNFDIYVDNNPWDCTHENWRHLLNEKLHDKFCNNVLNNTFEAMAFTLPPQCKLETCLLWAFGNFWIGVIVGNIFLIRRLLCPKKIIKKRDQTTQYDCSLIWISEKIRTENKLHKSMSAHYPAYF